MPPKVVKKSDYSGFDLIARPIFPVVTHFNDNHW